MPRVIGGSVHAHREHATARIFEAVRTLLYERGYDAITLAEVAHECGMSRTTMYNYFPDKASLVIGYAMHETVLFIERLDTALGEVDNPVDQLRAYVRLQLEYFSDHHLPPGPTLRLLMPEGTANDVLAHISDLESRLEAIVTSGRDGRYLVADDVPATVAMISACITRGSTTEAPLPDRIASTEGFILRAVGSQTGPDGTPKRLRRTPSTPAKAPNTPKTRR